MSKATNAAATTAVHGVMRSRANRQVTVTKAAMLSQPKNTEANTGSPPSIMMRPKSRVQLRLVNPSTRSPTL